MIKWKEYNLINNDNKDNIDYIFDIETNTGIDKIKLKIINNNNDSSVNYISRSAENNGVTDYVLKNEKYINFNNCITVGIENTKFFYQKETFICGQNISILRNKKLNINNGLFFVTLLNNISKNKYYYSINGLTFGRLKKIKIYLPIVNNEIAWNLMEKYIKILKYKLNFKTINTQYLKENNNKIIETNNWKYFNFFEIFDKNYGIGNTKKVLSIDGEIPLVSANSKKNGINKYIKINNDKLFTENSITLSKNGSVGNVFYQDKKFYATSDIMILKLKDYKLTNNIALFLKSVLEKHFKKYYDWNNKITISEVLPKTNILLPSKDNKIDYEYMEKYIEDLRNNVLK